MIFINVFWRLKNGPKNSKLLFGVRTKKKGAFLRLARPAGMPARAHNQLLNMRFRTVFFVWSPPFFTFVFFLFLSFFSRFV